ncbi:chemerin-like receptor 1 [Hoplias malabaricus]|uniref:chemerin-like receptor 1 n=1 Tax=Hoplias malabaricus TaxID=27720 RepID=UPI003461EB3E
MDNQCNETCDYDALDEESKATASLLSGIRMLYIVGYIIICALGVILNSYVIVVGCHQYHKLQKSPPIIWILALAVTHLVFSLFLVLQLLYAWHHFNWQCGAALCKFSSYVFYVSMFSTAAILSLCTISSRCPDKIKCGSHGTFTALVFILCSWTFGVILSSPSLVSRELRNTHLGLQCIDDFDFDKEKTTDDGVKKMTAVVFSRFLLGILVPMFLMTINICLGKLQDRSMKETYKWVIGLIKVAYLICWTPLIILQLVLVTNRKEKSFDYLLPAATVLAASHSMVNPLIYLLVGRKLNMKWLLKMDEKNSERVALRNMS